VLRIFLHPIEAIFYKTPISGAQTQIMVAVDPELDGVTGKYFVDCKQTSTASAACDDDTAAWLWKKSEELTNLAVKE
jgi:hypothetical protein